MRKLKLLSLAFVCFTRVAHSQDATWVSLATSDVKLDTASAVRIYATDLNNDRYPDFVTIKGTAGLNTVDNLNVYLNVPASPSSTSLRTFVDMTDASGVNAMPGGIGVSHGTTLAALADVNNDGNVDIVRGNYYHASVSTYTDYGDRCEVLLGDGQGHFSIVPDNGLHSLGLINPTGFSFLDYDKDGNIDLFIGVWFEDHTLDTWRSGYLLKGNGDGTFTNVSTVAGIATPEPMYGCTAVDWNNDGLPDIATAPYCRTGGQLWKNNGDGTFTNVAATANYNVKFKSGDNGQALCMWGSMPEDFDNDGDMDFYFSMVHGGNDANEGHSTIVVNSGSGNGYHLDWAMDKMLWKNPQSSHHGDYDGSWFDLDNDGLEDLAVMQGYYVPATDRVYIFRQDQGNVLTDITQSLGLLTTEMKDAHQVEAIDYDLDGDDDILFCNNGSKKLRMIKNNIGQDNHWTGVHLTPAPGMNQSTIGARITVWAGGVQKMREVYAGRGNGAGQQPFAMLFGLGKSTRIDSIQVRWPNANNSTTTVKNPPVDRYLTIGMQGLDIPQVAAGAQVLLKAYPNPAKDFILIQLNNNAVVSNIEVYNMQGQQMPGISYRGSTGATYYCDIKNLPAATYIVRVTAKDGTTFTQSFVKAD